MLDIIFKRLDVYYLLAITKKEARLSLALFKFIITHC